MSTIITKSFELSDREFNQLRQLVLEHTGISLSDAKRELVYGRLAKRLRALKLNSFRSYSNLLAEQDSHELENFTNAITTNLTSFFREGHHFEYMARTLIPELLEHNASNRRVRIWSAGCSTGEEPYSIAMVLRETVADLDSRDVKILATDLDSNVLAQGRAGVYNMERIEGLSYRQKKKWFRRGRGEMADKVKVVPELQSLITFKQLNLMSAWPMRGPFDLIICRNVVIYFDKHTQRVLFDRYADLLVDNGHLFVGHSESLYRVTERFRLVGQTIYRKLS